MKEAVPSLIPLLLVLVVLALSARARRRQAEQLSQQADQIAAGSEVMTTSGLYGTVVSRNDDETVQLQIAPGVEVKWALAALRDVASLPERFHQPRQPDGETQG
jgi:preprotein translocase subunit YajC